MRSWADLSPARSPQRPHSPRSPRPSAAPCSTATSCDDAAALLRAAEKLSRLLAASTKSDSVDVDLNDVPLALDIEASCVADALAASRCLIRRWPTKTQRRATPFPYAELDAEEPEWARGLPPCVGQHAAEGAAPLPEYSRAYAELLGRTLLESPGGGARVESVAELARGAAIAEEERASAARFVVLHGLGSLYVAPFPGGFLELYSWPRRAWRPSEVSCVALFAQMIGQAIALFETRLDRDRWRRRDSAQASTSSQRSATPIAARDVERVLSRTASAACARLRASRCVVRRIAPGSSGELTSAGCESDSAHAGASLPLADSYCSMLLERSVAEILQSARPLDFEGVTDEGRPYTALAACIRDRQGIPIGAIEVSWDHKRAVDDDERAALEHIAESASVGLEHAARSERLSSALAHSAALMRLTNTIRASLDLETLLQTAAEALAAALPGDRFVRRVFGRDRLLPIQRTYSLEVAEPQPGEDGNTPEASRRARALQTRPALTGRGRGGGAVPGVPAGDAGVGDHAGAAAGVFLGDELLALLSVHSARDCAWPAEDVALLDAVGDQLAIAFSHARAFRLEREQREQLRQREEELNAALAQSNVLSSIVDAVRSSLDKARILQAAADALGPALHVDRCTLWGFPAAPAPATRILCPSSPRGPPRGPRLARRRRGARGDAGDAAAGAAGGGTRAEEEVAALEDVLEAPGGGAVGDEDAALAAAAAAAGVRGYLEMEIKYGGEVVGRLELHTAARREWAEADRRMLRAVSRHLSVSLAHARAFRVEQEHLAQLLRKNAELEAAKADAEQAVLAKQNFLSVVTHELRTPMQSTISICRLLQDTGLTPQQEEYLEIVQNSGTALVELIGEILDCGKIERGAMELDVSAFSVRSVVENVVDLLAPTAAMKGLDFSVYVPPGHALPPFLLSDPRRIRQILINLMGNSIKFTARGASRRWHQLRLTVRDTGCGIRPEDRAKLFAFFSQLDQTRTRHFEGSGIGLFLSRNLAHLLGGEIAVESEGPGKGSSFTLSLRLQAGAGSEPSMVPQCELKCLAGRPCLIAVENDTRHRYMREQFAVWGLSVLPQRPASADELRQVGRPAPHGPPARRGASGRGAGGGGAGGGAEGPVLVATDLVDRPLALSGPGAAVRWLLLVRPFGLDGSSAAGAGAPAENAQYLKKPVKQEKLFAALEALLCPAELNDGCPRIGKPDETAQLTDKIGPHIGQAHPLSVLLAEDQPLNQRIVVLMLKKMGYGDVAVVGNGLEAVEAVERRPFDVDWMMPELDGLSAARRIVETVPNERRPSIVMLTAMGSRSDRDLCLSAGVQGYLLKPCRVEDLARALVDVSKARRAHAGFFGGFIAPAN
eukprot:tig00020806_g14046.t1